MAAIPQAQLPVAGILEVPVAQRLHPAHEPGPLHDLRREREVRHVGGWVIGDVVKGVGWCRRRLLCCFTRAGALSLLRQEVRQCWDRALGQQKERREHPRAWRIWVRHSPLALLRSFGLSFAFDLAERSSAATNHHDHTSSVLTTTYEAIHWSAAEKITG